MGKIKIYNKRGNIPYQVKKLLKDLEPILERKMITDPNFAATFRTANSLEELQRLHSVHCAETATIISEVKNEPNINLSEMEPKNINTESNKSPETEPVKKNNPVIDPLNEADPIIRDYVLQDDAYEQKSIPSPGAQNNAQAPIFDEPMNFSQAFDIPTDTNEDPKIGNKNESKSDNNQSQQKTEAPKREPVNPYFDEQTKKEKNKQTKRMAKYIVKAVVMCLEKGFVWWTTKDINEAKLIEMELKNEIDLSVLLSLSEDQQQTAKEFFARMCTDAISHSKVDLDDQEELIDALFDVLLEKGIAPTPLQNLALVAFQIAGAKVIAALGLSSMINSVLSGLKENHKQQIEDETDLMQEAESRKHEPTVRKEKSTEVTTTTTTKEEEYENAEVIH